IAQGDCAEDMCRRRVPARHRLTRFVIPDGVINSGHMRWPVLRALLVAFLAVGVATPSVAFAQNKKKPAGKKTEKKDEMKPDDGAEEKTEKKEEKTEKKEEKKDEGKPKPPPDPKDGPKPLGAAGEGPGPAAGIHGPQTGLTES